MIEIGRVVDLATKQASSRLGLVVDAAQDKIRVAELAAPDAAAQDGVLHVDVLPDAPGQPSTLRRVLVDRLEWTDTAACQTVGRVDREATDRVLRRIVLDGVGAYHRFAHARAPFEAGLSAVPVAGRFFGYEEMAELTESALDFWLTTGRFNDAFEQKLGEFLGLPYVMTCNSGSSANLLAVTALTSPLLGERALKRGDEVITVAAGFPTTVNPILQNGLVPVFVDVSLETLNVLPERLEDAVGERTRAVILAHTLGNPFDIAAVSEICRRHGLWLIEDCCDALGSQYQLPEKQVPMSGLTGRGLCGSFGHIASFSFYPAHHITMGEGGAVATADPLLKKILLSFRDWGRDCWCQPGRDNTCGHRFSLQRGLLPEGYDHKYVYSHVGYNLKITDMQAAVGLAQLARLPEFIARRRENHARLWQGLEKAQDRYILHKAAPRANPAWFGFPITLASQTLGRREELLRFLNARKIGTRLLFGGNILRQPYFLDQPHRLVGDQANTDVIMQRTFWVGVYPGLSEEQIDWICTSLNAFQ
jgi:CDP-4-dehydro-6-deoxyglucose reductase, E1